MKRASRGSRSRTRRRESAERVLAERAKRTPAQQLARLDLRGQRALKERKRLTALVEGAKR